MNRLFTTALLSAGAIVLSVSTCLASEQSQSLNQAIGVLGSQTGHVTVADPAMQKAIEMLIKHPPKAGEGKKVPNKQDNPIGFQPQSIRSSDKVLILGGQEVVPM